MPSLANYSTLTLLPGDRVRPIVTLHTFIIAYVITSISVFANGPSSSPTVNFAIRCLRSLTTRHRHLPPSRHRHLPPSLRHTRHRLEHHCRRTNKCHAVQPPSTTNPPIDARSPTSHLAFCQYYVSVTRTKDMRIYMFLQLLDTYS